MGAANALRVYHSWPHLEDRPFRLLIYMALRARDNDAEPWYGAGQEELAVIALGLTMNTKRERLAALRAVSRAMQALHTTGAIKTTRRARPGKQATYRLFLDGPTYDGERRMNHPHGAPVDNPGTYDGERRANVSERTTVSVVRTGGRTTVSGHTYDGERRTEEEEEEVLQGQELKDPEANLRNGEMWKAPPPRLNGSAKPPIRHDTPTP